MEVSYKILLNQVKAFVFDVDGVLTDGTIQITTEGEMYRTMHTKDGFALKTAVDKGYPVCIISGGSNEGVRGRLMALGIKEVHLATHNKTEVLKQFIKTHQLQQNEVVYMGDDIPDFEVMQQVGVPCAPQDAVPEIKALSVYVSHKKGGKGCVRDIIEQVLKVQDNWQWSQVVSATYD